MHSPLPLLGFASDCLCPLYRDLTRKPLALGIDNIGASIALSRANCVTLAAVLSLRPLACEAPPALLALPSPHGTKHFRAPVCLCRAQRVQLQRSSLLWNLYTRVIPAPQVLHKRPLVVTRTDDLWRYPTARTPRE